MIPAKDYMKTLTTHLQARFGSRLLYVGLQGSYARGEATEASDIDPMVILEDLSVRDLAAYRAILEEVGYFSLSCGFLCGRAELVHWNPLEICHLVHTTTDYYGTLEEFLPAYGRVDVENYVKLSLGNLFHQLCHHYVHADQETNAATLPQTGQPQKKQTAQKRPCVRNIELKRSGAVSEAPLQFLTECAGDCRNRYNYLSKNWLPEMF